MADNNQDRRLPATERKIRKAREEGQLARSRDLGHLAALVVGIGVLVGLAPFLGDRLLRLLAGGLSFDHRALNQPLLMVQGLAAQSWGALAIVVPVGAALALAGVAASIGVGGWNFTLKALEPKWEKIAPLAGFMRLFSLQSMGTTLKACALALVVGIVGAIYVQQHLADFAAVLAMPLPAALRSTLDLVAGGLMLLLIPVLVATLIDVPLQRTLHLRQLRMSHEEVKQENKENEGNPEVKGRIRQRMREAARRRMMAAVPGADLVVMNPTHYAVALKYDEASMAAPRVVAKGTDLVALRIRDIAKEAGVPVLQAPPLARALWAHTELEEEVPTALFAAVAQVLAWVFQLRQAGANAAAVLAAPPQPVVPAGMDPGPAPIGAEPA